MGLGLWDIDNISNRDRTTELVREKKPALIIGKPQSRAVGHIRFICGLYQLQVREGRWFAHEQPEHSITWKMKAVVGLKEVEGVCDSNQCVRKSTSGRISTRILTTSKCMADELHLRYNDQQAEQKLSKSGIDGKHGHCGGIDGVHAPSWKTESRLKSLDRFAMVMGIFKSGMF